jgi:hypothetical protein
MKSISIEVENDDNSIKKIDPDKANVIVCIIEGGTFHGFTCPANVDEHVVPIVSMIENALEYLMSLAEKAEALSKMMDENEEC